MAIDPNSAAITTEGRRSDDVTDLERRVSALERGAPVIQVGAGAPTAAMRDGAPYGDTTNVRMWLRLGGVWRYTTLT